MAGEPEYKDTIVQRLSQLLQTGEFSDVEFSLVNGDKIRGHKLIFGISCPSFNAMMSKRWSNDDNKPIEVEDIEPSAFKTMTECIYTDELKFDSISHAIAVYKAGDKYGLKNLMERTDKYIKNGTNVDNALEVLEYSNSYDISVTRDKCMKLVQEKTGNVVKSENFIKCKLSTLETIVNADKINISELELFNGIDKWAKYHAVNEDVPMDTIRLSLKNIIAKIRFLSMSLNEFISLPYKSEVLSEDEKRSILLNLNKLDDEPLANGLCKITKSRGVVITNKLNQSIQTTDLFEIDFIVESSSRNQVYVKWKVDNVLNIGSSVEKYCPTFQFNGYPFRICFSKHYSGYDYYVSLCLKCDAKYLPYGWSFNTKVIFTISGEKGWPVTTTSADNTFRSSDQQFFTSQFLVWSKLCNDGYVTNNSVIIELDLRHA